MKIVYTDNNATTQVAPEVLEEMLPYFSENYGNPSSMHTFGGSVGKKIQEARAKTAALINAEPNEIIFTSCGTESDNAAIMAALEMNPEKKHLITSAVEHPAIRNLYKYLETKKGYQVSFVSVDEKGILDLDMLYSIMTNNTAIISLMWANNETGVIFPVEEVAQKSAEMGILFHTDAVQAAGKIPIDIKKTSGVDMLSLSGHKIHAPKGIGALYVKNSIKFPPFLKGGHQEKGRRGGTENTASIVGLGKACELASTHLEDMDQRVRGLRDHLQKSLLEAIPASSVNGDQANRLPNTLSIGFNAIEGESILLLMDQAGICASSGSACTSGSLDPSHVLMAMKVPFESAHGTIRFSLSTYNTKEEMDYIIEKMPPIIKRLRDMSPFWNRR
ncbi:cysteine desulfurase (tRNA sulfurtransferase), PLP-dependent [Desulfamplus magnetovallimortis]|uniref:Cysteine desulfurase n=1 Tax=Desulfamplus magnetovallimortis TaxID=1246637 RepID=A0A1W1H7U6_9BACT|nr:cysteine desulfurase NifS [Desulfamplus magnetovallimortis]SLM28506.1 cysteine desulfurase (tRNA sulfurtransferase), PLP-dependent [Desulfamplus magnetovallimortis]